MTYDLYTDYIFWLFVTDILVAFREIVHVIKHFLKSNNNKQTWQLDMTNHKEFNFNHQGRVVQNPRLNVNWSIIFLV